MAARIEHAHERRRHADEQHVGKHHAQQPQHELRFAGKTSMRFPPAAERAQWHARMTTATTTQAMTSRK